jgi:hypothetical protein
VNTRPDLAVGLLALGRVKLAVNLRLADMHASPDKVEITPVEPRQIPTAACPML